jgi:hypothetical protein
MSDAPVGRLVRRWTVATLALASIAVEFRDPADHYFAYFTVLTNLLIGAWFVVAALKPRRAERWAGLRLAATVYGLATLGIYWVLLSPTHHPGGASFFANLGLHLVVPLAMALEDLLVPWPRLKPWAAWAVLPWPLAYCALSMIRGELTGWYPYFFFNYREVGGWGVQAAFIAVLLGVFIALGFGWRALVHRRQGAEATQAAP